MNENQRSIIYKIIYSATSKTYSFSPLQRVETFEAKDAEFFEIHKDLYLLFAHR